MTPLAQTDLAKLWSVDMPRAEQPPRVLQLSDHRAQRRPHAPAEDTALVAGRSMNGSAPPDAKLALLSTRADSKHRHSADRRPTPRRERSIDR
jgi:hypothetical protein